MEGGEDLLAVAPGHTAAPGSREEQPCNHTVGPINGPEVSGPRAGFLRQENSMKMNSKGSCPSS